jgi:hypothetical protein
MSLDGYQYVLELFKEDRTPLGRVPVVVDSRPMLEWVRFAGIRAARLPPTMQDGGSRVEPVWHPQAGRPYVGWFRARVARSDGGAFDRLIPVAYLSEYARQASVPLVERGDLAAGESFWYLVLALPAEPDAESAPSSALRLRVEEVSHSLSLRSASRAELLRSVEAAAETDADDPDDPPVFLPREVLDEAIEQTRLADVEETGGILIGHLCRDADASEILIVVTAQVSARHTRSELTRLTFTADTWADVQRAIDSRGRGEIYLGWWHSHVFMKETCKNCEKSRDGTCQASAPFMSAEDRALHRTVFPRSYSIALVISDSPCAGLSWRLFGWRYGMIAPRGVHVLRVSRPVGAVPMVAPPVGEQTDVANQKS